jgi:hypothetical protein
VNSDTGTAYLRLTKPLTTADTLIVGCADYPTSTSSSTFLFMYDGETTGVYVGVEPQTGRIIVYRGGVGVLGATVGHLIKYQSRHYIQVKVKCHSSEGTVEVRLAGKHRFGVVKYGHTDASYS